jgi:pimeloyl-ACP methyl ester carboxylesterase
MVPRLLPFRSDAPPPVYTTVRNDGARAAIVFVHGFSGDRTKTWGTFPDLIVAEGLAGWDIFTVGYASKLRLDFTWLWSADPSLTTLAVYLTNVLDTPPFDRYGSLALVAHSMGGLVVQRALLDDDALADRVGHVILFGTPSAGLSRAQLVARLKPQLADMGSRGAFITRLRADWDARFAGQRPFELSVIAGERDAFVPASSSLDPFPMEVRAVVPGDHLQIVKPADSSSMSVVLLRERLLGNAAPAGPRNSANVAAERNEKEQIVNRLWPNRAEIDGSALVDLAIALDYIGRRADATTVLEQYGGDDMDAAGTLAGRLKRRWLLERRKADAERAKRLYAQGFAVARERGDHRQAFYHGINCAFLALAYDQDRAGARELAAKVLVHCDEEPDAPWSRATRAEASLFLGDVDAAVADYAASLSGQVSVWEIESTYQQAMAVVSILRDERAADRLEAVFAGQGV